MKIYQTPMTIKNTTMVFEIIDKIKGSRTKRKEREQMQKDAQLRSEFKVVERGGYLWLTHDGVAFMKISNLANASSITEELNNARDTAIEYTRL